MLAAVSRVQNRGGATRIRGVTVFSWNPRRPIIRRPPFDRIKVLGRTNNFGDLLGPVIVDQLLESRQVATVAPRPGRRLLSIGSILHFSRDGDVIWGSGVNGKSIAEMPARPRLDPRAVRGPETKRVLNSLGVDVPDVYGDPGLLLPLAFPGVLQVAQHKSRRVLIAPNLNEFGRIGHGPDVLDPRRPLAECIQEIARSERVVGSSLHGLIVAEALGIPAIAVASSVEHPLKYDDYYRGTGRALVKPAPTIELAASGRFNVPAPQWDPTPLMNAFPYDLWSSR